MDEAEIQGSEQHEAESTGISELMTTGADVAVHAEHPSEVSIGEERQPATDARFTVETGKVNANARGSIAVSGWIAGGVFTGDGNSVVNYNVETAAEASLVESKAIFLESLKNRDRFIGDFLGQALRQANSTFRYSIAFMTAGGTIILVAAVLALVNRHTSASQSISLVTGLSGVLVGTAGAAFSVKSDKARKHLAQQADKMHQQLLDERRFNEVSALLTGIRDASVNDKVRVALALKLLGGSADDAKQVLE